ncbi:Hypothetical predicted protein [Octopus vulgaris]|uniref:Uncharacterized protein n=1 Tax=Octopus vulgaris TaxID=6645 RepID=A0AA36ALF2_OCTVU|nr:Hypothetical predicted protein [Octopus vulgaris]
MCENERDRLRTQNIKAYFEQALLSSGQGYLNIYQRSIELELTIILLDMRWMILLVVIKLWEASVTLTIMRNVKIFSLSFTSDSKWRKPQRIVYMSLQHTSKLMEKYQ